jgi:hypothetical protein
MNGLRSAWPVAMLLSLGAPALHATAICRWVDDTGRIQLAQTVPEKYRKHATCTDSRQYELTPEQRRAALQQAADDRARARAGEDAARAPLSGEPAPVRPAPAASRPFAKRPATVPTEATDCPTRWRLYDESAECFGPFRTARGGIKPEAFEVCNEVPRPEAQCGPRRD